VITDAAGNQSRTADLATVTVDTTPPTATISASVTGATNVTSDVITINAADANGVASVAIDDNGNFIANATQTSPGVWNYVATGLGQGSHDFTAVVTDNAGNSSTTGHASVSVDTTAPSVTFDTVSYDHTGAANFTKDGTVTLSGTTADNVTVSQVQVFSGTQLLGNAVVDNTSHTWTLTENLGRAFTPISARRRPTRPAIPARPAMPMPRKRCTSIKRPPRSRLQRCRSSTPGPRTTASPATTL
jgi:hypothetical protein